MVGLQDLDELELELLGGRLVPGRLQLGLDVLDRCLVAGRAARSRTAVGVRDLLQVHEVPVDLGGVHRLDQRR